MLKKALATTALVSTLSYATPAMAADFTLTEPHTGDRSKTLELHAGFGYFDLAPALGARVGIPIVKNGFIGSLNNSVSITVGADVYATLLNFGIGVGVPVTVAWNFYFNDQFSAFADVGINLYFNTNFLSGGVPFNPANYLMYGVGGRYHVSDKMALLAVSYTHLTLPTTPYV